MPNEMHSDYIYYIRLKSPTYFGGYLHPEDVRYRPKYVGYFNLM
jgi:hypothetical protein